MLQRNEWVWVIIVAACVVALASLPYVVVYFTTPPGLRFVGTLLNPLDGDSYLAKMQIGAQGGWLFHLPYTAQDHPGALLFTFHILLGHIAAWTHLPIPLVYHLARVVAGFALLLTVYALIARATQDLAERRIAFLLVALSSGLGWLAVIFGHLGTSDLLIPESNTFFGLHITLHFPLAVALMIGILMGVAKAAQARGGESEAQGDIGVRIAAPGNCPAVCSGAAVCDVGCLSGFALAAGWPHSVAVGVDDVYCRRW